AVARHPQSPAFLATQLGRRPRFGQRDVLLGDGTLPTTVAKSGARDGGGRSVEKREHRAHLALQPLHLRADSFVHAYDMVILIPVDLLDRLEQDIADHSHPPKTKNDPEGSAHLVGEAR